MANENHSLNHALSRTRFLSRVLEKLQRGCRVDSRVDALPCNFRRRRFFHEALEARQLLASDLLGMFSEFRDSTGGDIPFDAALVAEHVSNVAERVADNPHYRIDDSGNIMAIDSFTIPEDSKHDDAPDIIKMDPFPAEQTFLLNSVPGASKTIYLDFDGHTTSGTSWNSQFFSGSAFTTSAFNFEGSSATFSNNELFRIQRIWERIAEDYRPFNVNVTTQEPPLSSLIRSNGSDTVYGVRVVIGPGSWLPGAGGVAYLNSFTWNSDTPAFVFSSSLSNSEKNIAEAASHEAGHTLGLEHDGQGANEYYTGHGTGATGWAPIMGVGYNRELVQWSMGEYPNATQTQNDLSIITSLNGFSYRTDDHGGTTLNATPLALVDGAAIDEGIIERNTDKDFFSFSTVGGNAIINIAPFYRSPNLDILATLYNSSGTAIATSNPTSSLSASFAVSLAAGSYFLSIEGTGKAASGSDSGYTNYGSLGYYSIDAFIPQDPGSLVATLAGGNLTVQDTEGNPNQLSIEIIGSDLQITDAVEKFTAAPAGGTLSNGDRTLTIPLASLTSSLVLDLGVGDDTVDVGLWIGSQAPGLTMLSGTGNDAVNFLFSFLPEANRSLVLSSESVNIGSGSTLAITGTGAVTIQTDNLSVDATGNLISGSSPISITPSTVGRPVNLGSEVAGQLSITATELNQLVAGTIVIGNSSSGAITVSSSIALALATNVELRSGNDILLSGGGFDTGGGSLLLAPGASPFGVKPTANGTDASASTVSFASDLILRINGAVADVSYDRLNVAGTVDLTGVDLILTGSFPGITGNETFDLVTASSVVGTFNGLPHLSPLTVQGKDFLVVYSGTGVQLAPAVTNSTIQQNFVYHAGSSFSSGGVTPALDTSKSLAQAGASPVLLTYDNLINSSRGINGIVFDIDGLPTTTLSASDFEFKMSPQGAFLEGSNPPASWQVAPAPTSISVVPGALDRVVIVWPDNAIANRWLSITVEANSNTGLAEPETYYIGHLLGETTGPASGVYTVAFADITPIRSAVGQSVNAGSTTDIDKNGTVAFADISAMRGNIGAQLTNITLPAAGGGGSQAPLFAPGSGGTGNSKHGLTNLANPGVDSQSFTKVSALLPTESQVNGSSDSPLQSVGLASNKFNLSERDTREQSQGFSDSQISIASRVDLVIEQENELFSDDFMENMIGALETNRLVALGFRSA